MGENQSCRRCGHPCAADQRFCGGCGASLAVACPGCRSENPPGFRFCGACGAPLSTGTADTPSAGAPAAEVGGAGGGEEGREERRWATVVFADLSGFTGMSERTDPEEVRAIVDRCVGRMATIIEDHGGWFDSVLGDGVLAVFGADTAHGDDAERAVRTALALLACSTEHAEEFAGLSLSIGVNTGEVMFAAVGPGDRRDHTVLGDAVNTAARLQAAAPTGSIYVGEETWRATRSTVHYEPVAPIDAKGKRAPVAAWRALDVAALDAGRPVSAVPLIGRDAERAALHRTWRAVLEERRPHLVTVIGPAGIGKTKLANDLIQQVRADGGRVAHGRSLPYGDSTGYSAFAKALRQTLGLRDAGGAEDATAALRTRVQDLLPHADVDDVTANMAALLDLRGGAGTDKESLLFSARTFVEAMARQTPTLLVFEDIHWAEPSLLELIEVLATRCRDAPVLLLTLARPELFDTSPRWGGGVPAYTALPLHELTDADALLLASAHLGVPTSSELVGRVVAIGDGNPLFIEELTAAVLERATDADAELPSNVRTIIASRIDRLPDAERAVLLDAAVVGKVFWQGALEPFAHDDLERTLDALDRRDLIRREPESRFAGEHEFTFRHMLIREVAYATLPRAARRQRHAAIAGFLERVAPDRSTEAATTLGHHWREAGDADRAFDYLVAAAESAAAAWAAEESAQLYSEAMALLPEAAVGRRSAVQLARGLVLAAAGFYAEGAADLDAVLPHLEGRERAEALLARGNAAIWLMQADTVARCAEEASAVAAAAGIEHELSGPALSLQAIGRSVDGRLDVALDLQQRALAAWTPGVRQPQLASDLAMMSLTAYWVGDHDRSIQHGRRGYDMGLEHRSVSAALQGGSHLAMALTGAGRHEEALELFEKVVAQGRELERRPRLTSRTLNMMATALREVGDEGEARLRNEEGIEHAVAADFGAATAQGGIDLAFAAVHAGELGEAERRTRELLADVEALAGWHQWLGRMRLALARAEAALQGDDASLAAVAAEEAVRQAAAVGRRKYEALSRAALGEAHRRLGQHQEAVAALRPAAAIARDLGHPPTVWRTAAALAEGLHAAGLDADAASWARVAQQAVDDFAAGLSPLRRERFLSARAVEEVADLVRRVGG